MYLKKVKPYCSIKKPAADKHVFLIKIRSFHVMRKSTAFKKMGKRAWYTSDFLCPAWLFGALLILCQISADIEDMLTERGHRTSRLQGSSKAGGNAAPRQACICVSMLLHVCTSGGLPVEHNMWTPTHSAASRQSSFRINPQPLNINRTGILKLLSTMRSIMHRPWTS